MDNLKYSKDQTDRLKLTISKALEWLQMGARIEKVFDEVKPLSDKLFIVCLCKKYNILDTKKGFKFQQWFDYISVYYEMVIRVKLNDKWSFINTKGELIGKGNLWFDEVDSLFHDGFVKVKSNNKWSFVNNKGELIGNGKCWFDNVWNFNEGFAHVKLNNKHSFINTKGEVMGDNCLWFDDVTDFNHGIATVKLNNVENKIIICPGLLKLWRSPVSLLNLIL